MLRNEDLDAAVAKGLVTEAQALSLREFARQRDQERAAAVSHEERFRFMRGFNDFFFAVGIVLFAVGMGFFAFPTPAGNLIAAAITWALAEMLVGRLRLVLPGILLTCIFALFIVLGSPVDHWLIANAPLDFTSLLEWLTTSRVSSAAPFAKIVASPYLASTAYALVGAGAAAVFYARFRLPFALLAIAACLVAAALSAVNHLWMPPVVVGQMWIAPSLTFRTYTLLACGLLTFVVAMAFDLSDRERLTRRADCAFWLHLLAAPLIVHSLITLVAPNYAIAVTTPVAVAILAIFAVLTVIAIVIDRRALLVSALIYVGIVISYGIRSTSAVGQLPNNQALVLFTTLLLLGTLVLTLGIGWRPLRRLFLHILPAAIGRRLPPETARA